MAPYHPDMLEMINEYLVYSNKTFVCIQFFFLMSIPITTSNRSFALWFICTIEHRTWNVKPVIDDAILNSWTIFVYIHFYWAFISVPFIAHFGFSALAQWSILYSRVSDIKCRIWSQQLSNNSNNKIPGEKTTTKLPSSEWK